MTGFGEPNVGSDISTMELLGSTSSAAAHIAKLFLMQICYIIFKPV